MKILKRVTIWIAISLTIQFLGLLYLDKKIFVNTTTFKAVKVEEESKNNDIEITLPEDKDLRVSFDGKFISYLENGQVNLISTKTGETIKIENEDESEVSNYEWLSDRNRMLLVEKKKQSTTKSNLTIYYYDASKKEKGKMEELDNVAGSAKVDKIKASTLTNVTYIKVNEKGVKSSIYRIDINHNITQPNLMSSAVSNMDVIPHEDSLVYEDSISGSIYATAPKKKLAFNDKVTLLNIDSEDIVYIGSLSGDKISKITYGLLKEETSKWKTITLKEPMDKKDININRKGEILVNDNLNGIVTNLTTSKETSYKGKFLFMYDKGMASVSQGKLIKTEFNK